MATKTPRSTSSRQGSGRSRFKAVTCWRRCQGTEEEILQDEVRPRAGKDPDDPHDDDDDGDEEPGESEHGERP